MINVVSVRKWYLPLATKKEKKNEGSAFHNTFSLVC